MINSYLLLKDALVKSQPEETATRGRRVEGSIARQRSRNKQARVTYKVNYDQLEAINGTVKLDEQRAHFKPLSEAMIEIVRSMRGFDSPIYVQFCPMADGNKGAYWLSLDSEISNPYFGNQMLRCGSTTEVLQ